MAHTAMLIYPLKGSGTEYKSQNLYSGNFFSSFYIFFFFNSKIFICRIGRKQLHLSLPWEPLFPGNSARVGVGVGPCWLVLSRWVVLRYPLFCYYDARSRHRIICKALPVLSSWIWAAISSFWELLGHRFKGPLCIQICTN